jgi:hypothetical protein
MYHTRHSQRAVVSCEQLLMSYDSDTVPSRGPGALYVAHRALWIGSGRLDGRIGDGNGPRACGVPDVGIGPSAWADGTVRQLAWGTRVVINVTISSTSGAVDREWPLRWANRRRQWAAGVRCARCVRNADDDTVAL